MRIGLAINIVEIFLLLKPKNIIIGLNYSFKCELCTFKTFKVYQLKQYVRIHKKEKMYNCEICQNKLRLKYHILRHKRRKHLHENKLSCKCCEKLLIKTKELTRHLLTHKEVRHKR